MHTPQNFPLWHLGKEVSRVQAFYIKMIRGQRVRRRYQ
jgi:hypothetical protein